MCGICGIYYRGQSGLADQARLKAMTDTLAHRGPDADGFYFSEPAHLALGHRRLKVIDLERGIQPMRSGHAVTAFNGEIYNFRELREELTGLGHTFRTRSDTEVLLRSYLQWGTDCVRHFIGMFAFAVWDEQERRLVLARDRLGKKPLYFAWDRDKLVFGSEVRSVLLGLGFVPDVDPASLWAYLSLQYVPAPRTIFQGVDKLLPGTVMTIDDQEVKTVRYWSLPEPGEPLAGEAAALAVRELLEDAVEKRLVADVPVGAFLSGGIDSSSVVGMMRRHMGEGLKTFSVDFAASAGADAVNETRWSKLVSDRFQTEHYPLTVSAEDAVAALPTVVRSIDDPVADPAALPTYLVSRLAREQVTVVLTGEGADELFAGYQRYSLARLASLYQPLPRSLRQLLFERPAEKLPRMRRVKKALLALGADTPAARHLQWVTVFSPGQLEALMVRASSGREWVVNIFNENFAGQREVYSLGRTLRTDILTWLPDDLLVKVDRTAMAVGLEARVPFLDHRLVELAQRIPDREKIRGLARKHVLKNAVRGLVPAEVIARKKAGFTLPLDSWFRHELKPLMEQTLDRDRVVKAGLLDADAVEAIMQEHLSGRNNMGQQLFSILILQMWRDTLPMERLRNNP